MSFSCSCCPPLLFSLLINFSWLLSSPPFFLFYISVCLLSSPVHSVFLSPITPPLFSTFLLYHLLSSTPLILSSFLLATVFLIFSILFPFLILLSCLSSFHLFSFTFFCSLMFFIHLNVALFFPTVIFSVYSLLSRHLQFTFLWHKSNILAVFHCCPFYLLLSSSLPLLLCVKFQMVLFQWDQIKRRMISDQYFLFMANSVSFQSQSPFVPKGIFICAVISLASFHNPKTLQYKKPALETRNVGSSVVGNFQAIG